MIGLDTNVLLRYVVEDDKKQSAQVVRAFEKAVGEGDTFFISDIVVCEMVWVLGSAYKLSKDEILEVLAAVLEGDHFEFENHDRLLRAYRSYDQGNGDFADYVIGVLGQEVGCRITLTFDKSLRGDASFRLL